MSDFPRNIVVPTHIGALSRWMAGSLLKASGTAATPSSTGWTANTAVYIPLILPWAYNLRRFWWVNGATVTGNVDAGIYSGSGARLLSLGSTAQAGANNIQYAALAPDFLLTPGLQYFLGFALSNAATPIFGSPANANNIRESGCLQQASAFPLPAISTFAQSTNTSLPVVGITNTDSGF